MVRVQPGASRTGVGWDGAVLHVRVTARAAEGAANRALIQAVADALGVRRSSVSLVTGKRSRDKVIEVNGLDPTFLDSLRER